MDIARRSTGLPSALGRALLAAWALLVAVSIPENISSWDMPNASVIPAERSMPLWFNVPVGVAMVAATAMLVVGWVLRRRQSGQAAWVRWSNAATIVVLALWATALLVSQVMSMLPDDAVIGIAATPFVVLDAIAAAFALATAAVLARDVRTLANRARASAALGEPERV